jgi:hypothetical protein
VFTSWRTDRVTVVYSIRVRCTYSTGGEIVMYKSTYQWRDRSAYDLMYVEVA